MSKDTNEGKETPAGSHRRAPHGFKPDMIEDIEAVAGPGKRSAFVREAVRILLSRRTRESDEGPKLSPKGYQATLQRLKPEMIADIDAIAGKRKRPEFVREAVHLRLLMLRSRLVEAQELMRPTDVHLIELNGDNLAAMEEIAAAQAEADDGESCTVRRVVETLIAARAERWRRRAE